MVVGRSGERRENREWATYLHDHSLAVVGSRADIEAPVCSNEHSIGWLQSQGVRCRGIMVSTLKTRGAF